MARPGEDLRRGARLHDAPGIHDGDRLAHLGHHAEVMGDEQDGEAHLLLQGLQQLHDLRLDRHVECRRRLVGDEQHRIADDGHGDHHALAQPA